MIAHSLVYQRFAEVENVVLCPAGEGAGIAL